VHVVLDLDGSKGISGFCQLLILQHRSVMFTKADGSVAILFVMTGSKLVSK
jgi:hypothetical protein